MANVSKLTPEKEAIILDALRERPTYTHAARRARIHRRTMYVWRHEHPDFDARVQAARNEGFDAVEDRLIDRGLKDDTTALIFLLKGWRRERYGEKIAVSLDVRTAAERVAADLDMPVETVLAETYRMAEDG